MIPLKQFENIQVFQVFIAALAILIVKLCYSAHVRRKYWPPGPPGLPIFGNVFQLSQFQWFRFTEWKETYGSVFSLNLAGQPAVIINTHQAAVDLLNRRADIYSDRPRLIVSGEHLTGGIFIAFTNYGKQWLKLRRAAQEFLNVRVSKTYQPLQEFEATCLVSDMLQKPHEWDKHLLRSTTSTVLSSIYGLSQADSRDDSLVTQFDEFSHRIIKSAIPGAHLVELFPFLNLLPPWIAKWKREALAWHAQTTEKLCELLGDVRERMDDESSKSCFCSLVLENNERHGLTSKETAWLAGTLLGAGSETTAASLSVFVLAMCLYPDVMRKAQTQIDQVIGRDRLPTFADFDNLHYIRAIVKEVLRWRPIAPIAFPRSTNKDDWYSGYFIPKGTLVLVNVWAMNRDPEIFPDFEEFRPERFLDESETVDVAPPNTLSLGHVSYGFGKRICVGMNLANQALFIDIACLLWAFNIEKAYDENGQVIIPSRTEMIDSGIVVRPVPFKCAIKPRRPNVSAVIDKASGTVEALEA
ncbi:hypothetical protein VKT23_014535 [Stygiomarasmius scandens]|uniref:Cytochrome P450 n=1 Tax=Marasmiellus scandens TaxID=2682957 RepID=A0ABR1J2P7_9AGAR